MHNLAQPRIMRGVWLFGSAFLLMSVLTAQQALASTRYETYARVYDSSGPRTVCNDFFCSSTTVIPPVDIVDRHSGAEPNPSSPAGVSIHSNANAVVGLAGATATSVIYDTGLIRDAIKIGVSASSQRSGYLLGEAHARAEITFGITVEFNFPDDPFLAAHAVSHCGGGCPLAMDFQHQTTGRFSFSGVPGQGAEAYFSETLSMDSGANLSGEASIAADPLNGNSLTPGVNGLWSASDFYPPQTGTGGTELAFNHFESITNQFSIFSVNFCTELNTGLCLLGNYTVSIEQAAAAGFSGNSEYTTGGGVTSDFAHTSEFSPVRLYDPSGLLDLSNAQVNIRFFDPAPVPLPGAFWLFASALGAFSLKRVRDSDRKRAQ
ncbi:hypothetical protein [Methylomonas rhizoryzae]|uniref:hypothetical protein n=1 Tax=Methylomonas rhizoryzae TaxID=2608981 RepID=UPI001231E047|nr:hypothetical protein [Methylomonas rhizoryzae]